METVCLTLCNPNATLIEENHQPQSEDFNDSNASSASQQVTIFDLISNQEGEEECTSSKEELEIKETMSPLDHAFLIQTKPNSLETELAIENIFSMIEESVKPSSITLNKKRFTLKWPMTETVFLLVFFQMREICKRREIKGKRLMHAEKEERRELLVKYR